MQVCEAQPALPPVYPNCPISTRQPLRCARKERRWPFGEACGCASIQS